MDENAQDSLDSGAVCNQASKCGSSRATANWVFHPNSGKCEDGSGLTAGKVHIFLRGHKNLKKISQFVLTLLTDLEKRGIYF